MARRHEDRGPGQRFQRGNAARGRPPAPQGKDAVRRPPAARGKRRAKGLVVTPAKAPGTGTADGKVRLITSSR